MRIRVAWVLDCGRLSRLRCRRHGVGGYIVVPQGFARGGNGVKKSAAIALIGGIVIGTAAVAGISVMTGPIIPISIWTMSTTVVGSQTMNVLRVKTGQLQPVKVLKLPEQAEGLRRVQ